MFRVFSLSLYPNFYLIKMQSANLQYSVSINHKMIGSCEMTLTRHRIIMAFEIIGI